MPIAYHGSKVPNLKRFDDRFQGTGIVSNGRGYGGFFFSSDAKAAEFFADFDGVHPDSAFIVKAKLNLENPFVALEGMSPVQAIGEAYRQMVEDDKEFDGVIVNDYCDGDIYSTIYVVFEVDKIEVLS